MPIRIALLLTALMPCALASAGFEGTEADLRALVSESVGAELGMPPEFVQLGTLDQRLKLNACDSQPSVSFPFSGNRDTVRIDCTTPQWRLFLPIRIEEPKKVWMLTDDVAAADELSVATIEPTYSRPTVGHGISTDQQIVGWITTRALPGGHVLQQDDVEIASRVMIVTETVAPGGIIEPGMIAYQPMSQFSVQDQLDQQMLNPSTVLRATQHISEDDPLTTTNTEILQSVMAIRENVPRSTILTERHIERRLIAEESVSRRAITNADAVLGLQTTRALRAGHILNPTDLTDAVLIRKGEMVTLVMTAGALEVRADTLALEDGKLGDQIELQTLDSGNTVRAVVVGRNLANRL